MRIQAPNSQDSRTAIYCVTPGNLETHCPVDQRYRLYIDESGDASLSSVDDERQRYLSLTGFVAKLGHMREVITPKINAIKAEVFDSDPDEPIVLHRKEILQKKAPFQALSNPDVETRFNDMLLDMLGSASFIVMTVTIDKRELKEKYRVWRRDPYHYCFELMLERYVSWLLSIDGKGDVMAESRNSKPNAKLKATYARLYRQGSSYVSAQKMQAQLSSSALKIGDKKQNVVGLQIADLLAHPSAAYARQRFAHAGALHGFSAKLVNLMLRGKYHSDRRGEIIGYGQKWVP